MDSTDCSYEDASPDWYNSDNSKDKIVKETYKAPLMNSSSNFQFGNTPSTEPFSSESLLQARNEILRQNPQLAAWMGDYQTCSEEFDNDRDIINKKWGSLSQRHTVSSMSADVCQSLQLELRSKTESLCCLEKQHKSLKEENQRLSIQLANERRKAAHINQKIKYIQENQSLLLRLKDEYTALKTAQMTPKRPETTSIEIQTIGFECPSCIEMMQWRKKHEQERLEKNMTEKDSICVKESELTAIEKTLSLLKSRVEKRSLFWTNTSSFEGKYKEEISSLKEEVKALKNALNMKQISNDQISHEIKLKNSTVEKQQRDKSVLQNIIVKLEKRQRDMVKKYAIQDYENRRIINEKERKVVQHIIHRYIIHKTNQRRCCRRRTYSRLKMNSSLVESPRDSTNNSDIASVLEDSMSVSTKGGSLMDDLFLNSDQSRLLRDTCSINSSDSLPSESFTDDYTTNFKHSEESRIETPLFGTCDDSCEETTMNEALLKRKQGMVALSNSSNCEQQETFNSNDLKKEQEFSENEQQSTPISNESRSHENFITATEYDLVTTDNELNTVAVKPVEQEDLIAITPKPASSQVHFVTQNNTTLHQSRSEGLEIAQVKRNKLQCQGVRIFESRSERQIVDSTRDEPRTYITSMAESLPIDDHVDELRNVLQSTITTDMSAKWQFYSGDAVISPPRTRTVSPSSKHGSLYSRSDSANSINDTDEAKLESMNSKKESGDANSDASLPTHCYPGINRTSINTALNSLQNRERKFEKEYYKKRLSKSEECRLKQLPRNHQRDSSRSHSESPLSNNTSLINVLSTEKMHLLTQHVRIPKVEKKRRIVRVPSAGRTLAQKSAGHVCGDGLDSQGHNDSIPSDNTVLRTQRPLSRLRSPSSKSRPYSRDSQSTRANIVNLTVGYKPDCWEAKFDKNTKKNNQQKQIPSLTTAKRPTSMENKSEKNTTGKFNKTLSKPALKEPSEGSACKMVVHDSRRDKDLRRNNVKSMVSTGEKRADMERNTEPRSISDVGKYHSMPEQSKQNGEKKRHDHVAVTDCRTGRTEKYFVMPETKSIATETCFAKRDNNYESRVESLYVRDTRQVAAIRQKYESRIMKALSKPLKKRDKVTVPTATIIDLEDSQASPSQPTTFSANKIENVNNDNANSNTKDLVNEFEQPFRTASQTRSKRKIPRLRIRHAGNNSNLATDLITFEPSDNEKLDIVNLIDL